MTHSLSQGDDGAHVCMNAEDFEVCFRAGLEVRESGRQ